MNKNNLLGESEMLYRARVYWRYWRRTLHNFNADVREAPWSRAFEGCFTLGAVALMILYIPSPIWQQLFERVILVAVRHAMVAWLALIPLTLSYTWIIKHWTGGK
jgi:hypothetical protein